MPKLDRSYGPFDGNGRIKVAPIEARSGTIAISVTKASARRIIDAFCEAGESFHSVVGATVWVVEAWCKSQGVDYKVDEQTLDGRMFGYVIRRKR